MKSEAKTPETGWSAAEYVVCGLAVVMIALGATFAPELKQLPFIWQTAIAVMAVITAVSVLAVVLTRRTVRQVRRNMADSTEKIIALGDRLMSAADIAHKRHDATLALLEPYFLALEAVYGREGENRQGWNINGDGFVDARSFMFELRALVQKHGIVKLLELAQKGELPEELTIENEAVAEFVAKRLRTATF